MAERKTWHVTSAGDGDWKVKARGADRAAGIFSEKVDAVERGRELARGQSLGQLVVHGRNGRIQTEYTYGRDPYPPQG